MQTIRGIEECPMKVSFLMWTGRVKENQHRILKYYSGLNGSLAQISVYVHTLNFQTDKYCLM